VKIGHLAKRSLAEPALRRAECVKSHSLRQDALALQLSARQAQKRKNRRSATQGLSRGTSLRRNATAKLRSSVSVTDTFGFARDLTEH
jgi:hypothetical protein